MCVYISRNGGFAWICTPRDSRDVNVHGRPGRVIPICLYHERPGTSDFEALGIGDIHQPKWRIQYVNVYIILYIYILYIYIYITDS